jgi:membrane peptidoglycan carboxypeptidase
MVPDALLRKEVKYRQVGATGAAQKIRSIPLVRLRWKKGIICLLVCTTAITAAVFGVGFYHIYLDRTNLPDIGSFARFEFSTIGHVYDANDQPLAEVARQYRKITRYDDIPPIIRDAILATEDKRFFSHSGVDYFIIPRVLAKIRIGSLLARFIKLGGQDEAKGQPIFPQGGSTITQQLVRGYFLQNLTDFQNMTAQENSNQIRHGVLLPRLLSCVVGARSANMLVRKLEEIRLSLWVEKEMEERFGSKHRAKEEILARYVSFIHMGNSRVWVRRSSRILF